TSSVVAVLPGVRHLRIGATGAADLQRGVGAGGWDFGGDRCVTAAGDGRSAGARTGSERARDSADSFDRRSDESVEAGFRNAVRPGGGAARAPLSVAARPGGGFGRVADVGLFVVAVRSCVPVRVFVGDRAE